ncbi:MAG TPA: hypothetical protein DEB39_11135 [Planctomycetaceae bacterium]|nr:hypothetical protein [Planctomycetaceae bacterium]
MLRDAPTEIIRTHKFRKWVAEVQLPVVGGLRRGVGIAEYSFDGIFWAKLTRYGIPGAKNFGPKLEQEETINSIA